MFLKETRGLGQIDTQNKLDLTPQTAQNYSFIPFIPYIYLSPSQRIVGSQLSLWKPDCEVKVMKRIKEYTVLL